VGVEGEGEEKSIREGEEGGVMIEEGEGEGTEVELRIEEETGTFCILL
jgi:hypothetical protein